MIPVIMSGGSGTRLWPISRTTYPKQFNEFFERTLIEETIDRVSCFGQPYILTSLPLRDLTLRLANKIGLDRSKLIFEPLALNTAPAIALLCHLLLLDGHDDVEVGIFPADQMILNRTAFEAAVSVALKGVGKYDVVTLGITPQFPATGYGYIECDRGKNEEISAVLKFREKPSLEKAQEYIDAGNFYWNAGIFIFNLKTMAKTIRKLAPELWQLIILIKKDLSNALDVYQQIQPDSFDYAIMEKLNRQGCVPADLGWSDLGSWDNIIDVPSKSTKYVLKSGARVLEHEAKNNSAFSSHNKAIAFIGCNDLIAIDSQDALLICKKSESQKVKFIVSQLQAEKSELVAEHQFDHRPWGNYRILEHGKNYKAKTIEVEAGQQLSYQSHAKRSEHWIVVEGQAEVVLNEKIHKLNSGDYISIPVGAKHRMRNPGTGKVVFIEIQTGTYFGEDDIIRYQDDYNRKS